MKASKSFDKLKEHTEGEGEFGESTSRPLVDAEVVISVVDIFFFHGFVSNIGIYMWSNVYLRYDIS